MTIAEEYLNGSRLFRRLKNGTHGRLVELYAARLVEVGCPQCCPQRGGISSTLMWGHADKKKALER